MLGLDTQLGRLYSAQEDSPTAERVVLLTDRLWQRKFDRSSNVLDQTIMLNDEPYTVIGVLPSQRLVSTFLLEIGFLGKSFVSKLVLPKILVPTVGNDRAEP